jgi:hypothetical protein
MATLSLSFISSLLVSLVWFEGFVKSQKMTVPVIPAKAGIQQKQALLDPGFRRGDDFDGFYEAVYGLFIQRFPSFFADPP